MDFNIKTNEESLNLLVNGKKVKIVSVDIMKIGNEVASLWGGQCFNYEIDSDNEKIILLCKEFDEEFVTSISFYEVYNSYLKNKCK